jgi:hypothetical protein
MSAISSMTFAVGLPAPAYVSLRQHTSAYVSMLRDLLYGLCRWLAGTCTRQHTSAHVSSVSIRQHTSAYVSIRQHTSRQHTSAYVSIRQHTSAYVSIRHVSIRQHTSAYVSTRQHTSEVPASFATSTSRHVNKPAVLEAYEYGGRHMNTVASLGFNTDEQRSCLLFATLRRQAWHVSEAASLCAYSA